MKSDFLFLTKQIYKGKSVLRSFLNLRLKKEEFIGKTIDIGGGKNSDYLPDTGKVKMKSLETFDVKSGAKIDFESDRLPVADDVYETTLFLNVLEHIYNHKHILSEVIRITSKGGRVIGYVPFLMWYHPDHSDYFRYTHEALEKIFVECGVNNFDIEPMHKGPFMASAQMVMLSIPRLFRVPAFSLFYVLDILFLKLRPGHGDKYVLGYYFVIHKK